MKVIVIGAGLGGISASCLLAYQGHDVTVIEKNSGPGGKINEFSYDGFRFDTGPSLLTMPFILEKLFSLCGHSISDYLEIVPIDPVCRYFYSDGTRFDCYHSTEKNQDQIRTIAPSDLEAYNRFMTYSGQLYERTKQAFLFNPLYSFSDLSNLNLSDLLRIDANTNVSERVDSRFQSPYLRQFFKRFATYNGSSPFRAPATLNVIPHVELTLGGYYVKGGMYQIVKALTRLAQDLGVVFRFDTSVHSIEVTKGKASGVETDAGIIRSADLIVSNSDATETYTRLLPDHAISRFKRWQMESMEPSCSGLVLMLGVDREYDQLLHHNVFFSTDYKKEFRQIFEQKVMPDEPTIYVANTSRSDPGHTPEGSSNLFILINAPYLSDSWHWTSRASDYGDLVIEQLENRGLTGLQDHIVFRKSITPADFSKLYNSHRGSIYGTSSNNRLAAFLRPRNKSRSVNGLYLVGGSTHPGGGIPLVILSAFHAVELINKYES